MRAVSGKTNGGKALVITGVILAMIAAGAFFLIQRKKAHGPLGFLAAVALDDGGGVVAVERMHRVMLIDHEGVISRDVELPRYASLRGMAPDLLVFQVDNEQTVGITLPGLARAEAFEAAVAAHAGLGGIIRNLGTLADGRLLGQGGDGRRYVITSDGRVEGGEALRAGVAPRFETSGPPRIRPGTGNVLGVEGGDWPRRAPARSRAARRRHRLRAAAIRVLRRRGPPRREPRPAGPRRRPRAQPGGRGRSFRLDHACARTRRYT